MLSVLGAATACDEGAMSNMQNTVSFSTVMLWTASMAAPRALPRSMNGADDAMVRAFFSAFDLLELNG